MYLRTVIGTLPEKEAYISNTNNLSYYFDDSYCQLYKDTPMIFSYSEDVGVNIQLNAPSSYEFYFNVSFLGDTYKFTGKHNLYLNKIPLIVIQYTGNRCPSDFFIQIKRTTNTHLSPTFPVDGYYTYNKLFKNSEIKVMEKSTKIILICCGTCIPAFIGLAILLISCQQEKCICSDCSDDSNCDCDCDCCNCNCDSCDCNCRKCDCCNCDCYDCDCCDCFGCSCNCTSHINKSAYDDDTSQNETSEEQKETKSQDEIEKKKNSIDEIKKKENEEKQKNISPYSDVQEQNLYSPYLKQGNGNFELYSITEDNPYNDINSENDSKILPI